MGTLMRSALIVTLGGIVVFLGMLVIGSAVSNGVPNNKVVAQSSAPQSSAPQQATTKPLTEDPRPTILRFMEAVELGDKDVVSDVTGAKQGKEIKAWCATDLNLFVGHTDFWPFTQEGGRATYESALPSNASGDVDGANWSAWMIKTYDNGLKACVHVDTFMRFLDPSALPSTRNICHFYIDGDFKLEAAGGEWIITELPNYQEARNDSPWKWGYSPYHYPYPGDALGPYSYPPGHNPRRYGSYSGHEYYR